MSFDPRLDARWDNIIRPAVHRIAINDTRLEAVRVDTRRVSDSILTEILTGIGESRLVLADLTALDCFGGRPIHNANVMYEVGLAQATRLPEEVLLFRSDEHPLLFDLANVRVNKYYPDADAEQARIRIIEAIADSIKEIYLRRHLAVKRAVSALDGEALDALIVRPRSPWHILRLELPSRIHCLNSQS